MEYNKSFFEKVFSTERMARYYSLYPNNENRAKTHYECNLMLSESLYISLSVLEVTLRNALSKELMIMAEREDWYSSFINIPELNSLVSTKNLDD